MAYLVSGSDSVTSERKRKRLIKRYSYLCGEGFWDTKGNVYYKFTCKTHYQFLLIIFIILLKKVIKSKTS